MNDFSYYAPTRYEFGRGAEMRAGALARQAGCSNVLLVYGMGSAVRSGLLDKVKASLSECGISFADLGGVRPNPTDDKVYEGIEMARRLGIDGLVAVGGGSAIDTAKAIAAGKDYDGDFWDFYCGKAVIESALPVGVVLSIPAAGSEGSGNSVITRVDGMKKLSLRTDSVLRPKFACLNPEYTFTLPPYQTASGIADMMAHIFERYISPTEGVEVTDRLAEGLLMSIIREAATVMQHPCDYDARANIMWAGTLAHNGLCGTGRTEDWASHAMEHELSALYGVTHGAGLAVVMPAWMEYMISRSPGKIAQMARRVFNIDCADDVKAAEAGVSALRGFFSGIGLPVTLRQLGIENPDIPLLVKNLHANKGEIIGGYMRLSAADTAEIYRLCDRDA